MAAFAEGLTICKARPIPISREATLDERSRARGGATHQTRGVSLVSVEDTRSQSPDTDLVAAGESAATLGRCNLEDVLVL